MYLWRNPCSIGFNVIKKKSSCQYCQKISTTEKVLILFDLKATVQKLMKKEIINIQHSKANGKH